MLSFEVSDKVVFTTSSSSFSPCAIRAVDAMVSWRDGWSSQDTLSGTSVSPKSSREALAARLFLAGLTLYVPLEEVTACLKISYCAAEIFLLLPSTSSSSERALLESTSNAALKLSGDSSRAVDSTDEDLESGERDLESLDSLWFLVRLTDVLGGLTGVLACLSASLACLTRELMELWGIWRNLSGDLGLLSGDPAGVADLLLVESCPGTGNDDWTAGLMELSGTLGRSKRRWSNVHNDIKSTSVDWLMVFEMEGKSGGVLVPAKLETSGPPTGLAAGSPALPIRPLPLLEEVLDHRIRLDHQNVILSYEMTPPSRHLLGCQWPCHKLWPGRHLWPSRPLLPSRPLWPGRCRWPSRCLWPCRCVLPGRHAWPSCRLLPGRHLPIGTLSSSLAVTGLRIAVWRRPWWRWWEGSTIALRQFFCAVALACTVHASGSQSLHMRQGLSWVQSGKPSFKRRCWQRRWLSFLRRKWEHSGNFGCDSVDDDLSRDLSAIFSSRHGLPKT